MRHLLLKTALLGVVGLGASSSLAGPISYQGGWMFSTDNEEDFVNWQVSYSIRPWFSLGVDYAYDKMEEGAEPRNYVLPRVNFLLKRWNELDSQANIYLFGGAGAVRAGNETSAAWLGGIEADWETRKYYTSARAQYMDSAEFDPTSYFQARLGIAPYLTKFENLHTWVIAQVQYWPEAFEEKWRVGPVMRFYIENVLWEIGVTSRGTWMFNTMVHF